MSSDLTEAVARALCVHDGVDPDDRVDEWVDGHTTAEVSDPAWTEYVPQAQAVIPTIKRQIATEVAQSIERRAEIVIVAGDYTDGRRDGLLRAADIARRIGGA